MTVEEIKRLKCTCNMCGHIWESRAEEVPAVCPKCHSVRWNRVKKETKKEGA